TPVISSRPASSEWPRSRRRTVISTRSSSPSRRWSKCQTGPEWNPTPSGPIATPCLPPDSGWRARQASLEPEARVVLEVDLPELRPDGRSGRVELDVEEAGSLTGRQQPDVGLTPERVVPTTTE